MIGWAQLRDDVEMVSDTKFGTRLEEFKMVVTVATRKRLQELAWACVGEGCRVNLHTPDFITIIDGQNDERVVEARVRLLT